MSHKHSRSVSPAQLTTLLLTFLSLSILVGVLGAGILVPAVGTSAIATKAGLEVFDELPDTIQVVSPASESRMLDAEGHVIARFYDKQRIVIPADKIAPIMKKAIVAIEDKRFFEHHGVDPTGIARAMLNNLNESGGMQGASTITQQYVRNALAEKGYLEGDADQVTAATEQTPERKLREIKYALAIEKQLDKDQILSGYLNIAPFGPITYGVEAASQLYFSKSANELTTGEAALLAGLVQSPVQFNPLQNPEAAQNRRNIVLTVMAQEGIITGQERDDLIATPIADQLHPNVVREGCSGTTSANAYFCAQAIRQFLAQPAFGKTAIERERLLKTGGLTIRTTMDPKKQEAAYNALVGAIPVNDPSDLDAALVSVVPQTGFIAAMAQNTNYGVAEGETMNNYSADGSFQVGSTFKVFALTEWFKEGHGAYESVGSSNRWYTGQNFKCDGVPLVMERWRAEDLPGKDGAFSVVTATGLSVNQAFINMASRLNFCKIFDTAAELGVTQADGSPIAALPANILGSGSASPLTMARAFATFVNDGKICTPTAIASVTDRSENVLKEYQPECTAALDPEVAKKVAATLGRSAGQYYTSTRLAGGRPFGAKSGTTNENSNTWLTGFTPELATSTWVGHAKASNTPVNNVTINGRFYSAIYGETFVGQNIWAPYMSKALEGTPFAPLPVANIGAPPAPSPRPEQEQNGEQPPGAGGQQAADDENEDD